jgi:hypothetical protein
VGCRPCQESWEAPLGASYVLPRNLNASDSGLWPDAAIRVVRKPTQFGSEATSLNESRLRVDRSVNGGKSAHAFE